MKEIGGYIELDTYNLPMLHSEAIALNCGRNGLAYLCEAKDIRKIKLPYFLCNSVPELCMKENVKIEYYHIDEHFLPTTAVESNDNEAFYLVNYYGQIDNDTIKKYKEKCQNLIVDNAQSYFQMPVDEVDTIYTCRKYFGVPDGSFLYTCSTISKELQTDESFDRMQYLLGRYERNAFEFYEEYCRNNKRFASEPIKKMSRLTKNLLHGIDYDMIYKTRRNNYDYLNYELKKINRLDVKTATFMYPLMIENGDIIRKKMQQLGIYIPILWPNVLHDVDKKTIEYQFACNILPLPIDQRYSQDDMEYVINTIKDIIYR